MGQRTMEKKRTFVHEKFRNVVIIVQGPLYVYRKRTLLCFPTLISPTTGEVEREREIERGKKQTEPP